MEESIVTTKRLEEDTFEKTIRPDSIDEYIVIPLVLSAGSLSITVSPLSTEP